MANKSSAVWSTRKGTSYIHLHHTYIGYIHLHLSVTISSVLHRNSNFLSMCSIKTLENWGSALLLIADSRSQRPIPVCPWCMFWSLDAWSPSCGGCAITGHKAPVFAGGFNMTMSLACCRLLSTFQFSLERKIVQRWQQSNRKQRKG